MKHKSVLAAAAAASLPCMLASQHAKSLLLRSLDSGLLHRSQDLCSACERQQVLAAAASLPCMLASQHAKSLLLRSLDSALLHRIQDLCSACERQQVLAAACHPACLPANTPSLCCCAASTLDFFIAARTCALRVRDNKS